MKETFEPFEEDNLEQVAAQLLQNLANNRIFAFYGAMGVGKTTLIKAICQYLKVTDTVGSPSFSLVNQYLVPDGHSVFHFDFYRMKKLEEAYDIGYEDYFYSGNYCFIEWPEKVETLLPAACVRVYLEERQGVRYIRVDSPSNTS